MPRPTFFALPDAKRRRVTDAAVKEFALNPYAAASLDRIAARARVSKGSLYQYFEGKRELYEWLLNGYLPEQKRRGAPPPRGDFFAWLEGAFLAGLSLFRSAPLLAALGARAALPTSDPDAPRIHAALRRATHEGLCALLRAAQAEGSVREDVPVEVAADLVAALMGDGLLAGLARRVGCTVDDVLANPKRIMDVPMADVTEHVERACELLRRAMGVARGARSSDP